MRTLRVLCSIAIATLAVSVTRVAAVQHRVCGTFNSIYYDIRTGSSGTTMQRWSNGQMLDSNWFAKLNMPVPLTAMWGEGVAFAATMQTRGVWVNMETNSPAYWDVINGEDMWRFSTTISGSPTQLVFRAANCVDMTTAAPTPPPATVDPNIPVKVCLSTGLYHYDIRTSPAGTVMERYNVYSGQLVDTNTFATLHRPPTVGAMWSEGVVFAATMQSRQVWINTAPNTAAWWAVVGGEDLWVFETTTMNGAPATPTFRASNCVSHPPPSPPTPAPAVSTRVCLPLPNAATYYEIRTGPAGTWYDRRVLNTGALMDSNWFATLNMPVPLNSMWGEGVQFAATMQSRGVWLNPEPNTEARWEIHSGGEVVWRFSTSIGGSPVAFLFSDAKCMNWV